MVIIGSCFLALAGLEKSGVRMKSRSKTIDISWRQGYNNARPCVAGWRPVQMADIRRRLHVRRVQAQKDREFGKAALLMASKICRGEGCIFVYRFFQMRRRIRL